MDAAGVQAACADGQERTFVVIRPRHLPGGVVPPALQNATRLDRTRLSAAGARRHVRTALAPRPEPPGRVVRPRHLPEGVVAPALPTPVGLDRARLGAPGAQGAEEPALGVGPRHLAEGIAAPALETARHDRAGVDVAGAE